MNKYFDIADKIPRTFRKWTSATALTFVILISFNTLFYNGLMEAVINRVLFILAVYILVAIAGRKEYSSLMKKASEYGCTKEEIKYYSKINTIIIVICFAIATPIFLLL